MSHDHEGELYSMIQLIELVTTPGTTRGYKPHAKCLKTYLPDGDPILHKLRQPDTYTELTLKTLSYVLVLKALAHLSLQQENHHAEARPYLLERPSMHPHMKNGWITWWTPSRALKPSCVACPLNRSGVTNCTRLPDPHYDSASLLKNNWPSFCTPWHPATTHGVSAS